MYRRLPAGVSIAALCLCLFALRGEAADEAANASARKSADLRSALVGTWRVTSMKIDGEAQDLPASMITYKHVTPAGFTWLSFDKADGKIFRAGGGTYTLNGDDYVEKIEYGMGDVFDQIKGGSHAFKCRIEGDTWYHTGKLASGTAIDEVWVRVKPAEAGKPAATPSKH